MIHKIGLLIGIIFQWSANAAAQDFSFSHPSGFYQSGVSLSISHPSEYQCYYSLDGSDPLDSDILYSGEFELNNRTQDEDGIAHIPTNPANTFELFRWRRPLSKVPKANILKAALFQNGTRISAIQTREYFIGPQLNDIELPIISIQIDSSALFDYESGIFVPGKDYDDNPFTWQPGNYFNRGDEWERIALFSYYENQELKLHQSVNLQIHGGASRIMPSKSLRISAKENLGKAYLDFPFFKDKPWSRYKRIILRNGGQDFYRSYFRDALMHSLVAKTQPYYQATQPAVVFINGIYWGILNIRERYDKYYFSNFHQQPLESIDYVEIAMAFVSKEGSAEDFENMIEELPTLDMSLDSDYQKIVSQINIKNYIDIHISKVYAGGTDWSGNNERLWRAKNDNINWNWIASDYDDGFRNLEKESFKHATNEVGEDWPNPEWSTRLFRTLMQNEKFANQYKNRLVFLLRSTYHPDNVIPLIDSIAQNYRNEIPRHINRWTYPESMEEWEAYVLEFKAFSEQRISILLDQFEAQFPSLYQRVREFNIYPNPANTELVLTFPKQMTESGLYEIYNLTGQLITAGELTNQYDQLINLEKFSAGIYLLKTTFGTEILTSKFEVVK